MKKFFLVTMVLALQGCVAPQTTPGKHVGLEVAQGTAPGYPLPTGIAVCNKIDMIGRCMKYSTESDYCVNPKGINEDPPILPCSSLKRKD